MKLKHLNILFPDQTGHIPAHTRPDGIRVPAMKASEPVMYEYCPMPDPEEESLVAKAIGGAKEFINQLARKNAAMQAEWFKEQGTIKYYDAETGEELGNEEIMRRIEEDGNDILTINGLDEQAGAEAVKNHGQTAAAVAATTAIVGRGRSLLRDPGEAAEYIAKQIKEATTNTRSYTEAMGKAGMQQAKERMGIATDKRYVDRYHGPDDIGRDANNRLTEIEAKGSMTNNTSVAKNVSKEKQSSAAKNKRRAELMTSNKKRKKIDQPSNRQGGAYTQDEFTLWKQISKDRGNKRHISTHTNAQTGEVRVIERDKRGNVEGEAIEPFKMEFFDEIQQVIKAHFKAK